MMMMMMSSTLMTSSSSFDNVLKKKNQFRLNKVQNKVQIQQKNIKTIKAEAISEDSSSSSFSKNSGDIFADLVENSLGGSTNNGFVERGEHIISSQFNQHQNQSI